MTRGTLIRMSSGVEVFQLLFYSSLHIYIYFVFIVPEKAPRQCMRSITFPNKDLSVLPVVQDKTVICDELVLEEWTGFGDFSQTHFSRHVRDLRIEKYRIYYT